jgi:hypothetical protein
LFCLHFCSSCPFCSPCPFVLFLLLFLSLFSWSLVLFVLLFYVSC